MKNRIAAILSGTSLLIAGLYTATVLHKGLRIDAVLLPRQVWIQDNTGLWTLGIWLWLAALFGWMALLVTLMWSYLPGHRVSSMLQSGLIVIAAALGVAGLVIWMSAFPYIVKLEEAYVMMPFVDKIVLGLLGAGLFMGGAATAWIGWDLAQEISLNWVWGAPPLIAGLLALPSPFVLPMPWLLAVAGLVWIGWSLFVATRREIPSAYAEYK